jgi:NAD(P)-dependent dehydrogenase (short-subunit alcohol dehydrogenase family)
MNQPAKHLVVLTGASRGMGLAMAQQLLATGHTVLCLSRQIQPSLDDYARMHGATVLQWSQDLSDSQGASMRLQQWLHSTSADQWVSATLINNAGVIPALVPLREAEPSDLAHALRVGLEAPMALCAAFLQATAGWAIPRKVLNVSSGLGRRAMASQAAYCAAKAGMDHFTRCLALDEALLPQGAKVCSLAPGVIDTDMQVQLRHSDPSHFPDQGNFAGMHTQGQLTSPPEAAARVLAYLERSDFGANPVADVRG